MLTEYGHLIVDGMGVTLRKKKRRILIIDEEKKDEIPIKSVRDLIISGRVNITSELIKTLAASGVDILFTTPTGKPIARVVGAKVGGTARNRYEQYKSLEDRRGVEIAKRLILGKIRNQMSNIRYYSKSRRASEVQSSQLYEIYKRMKEKYDTLEVEELEELEAARKIILAYEGECANYYWDGIKVVMGRWNFDGRDQRGGDPVNVSLNIAYNLLMGQIWKYTLKFGLDPFLGYVHVERPGRLSLVFDLMEPFRPMVDRFVISLMNRMGPAKYRPQMLFREFYNGFMQSHLDYKGRRMRMETVMFYFVQDLVSYLKNGRSFTVPYMPW